MNSNINKKKLCTITGIRVSAFIGGPLGAFYLISKNFEAFGNKLQAKKHLIYGLLFTIIIFFPLAIVPDKVIEKIPLYLIPVIYGAVISVYTELLQKNAIDRALSTGVTTYSGLKIFGISIASLAITLIFGFLIIILYGALLDNSVSMLKVAATLGDRDAQYNLGVKYQQGDGLPQSDEQAIQWLLKSAAQNNSSAQNNLGAAYHKGKGVPQNDVEAFKWYEKSATQGNVTAEKNLSYAFLHGLGVSQNEVEAMKWILKAANQGDPQAQFIIGLAYYVGKSVPQNHDEAMNWLHKAADQGYLPARDQLERLK